MYQKNGWEKRKNQLVTHRDLTDTSLNGLLDNSLIDRYFIRFRCDVSLSIWRPYLFRAQFQTAQFSLEQDWLIRYTMFPLNWWHIKLIAGMTTKWDFQLRPTEIWLTVKLQYYRRKIDNLFHECHKKTAAAQPLRWKSC